MIKKIKLLNFLGFVQKNDDLRDMFEMNFCKGANILIGENGVGKTSLMKLIYAFCMYKPSDFSLSQKIGEMFDWNTKENFFAFGKDKIYISIEDEEIMYNMKIEKQNNGVYQEDKLLKDKIIPAVFIPSKEMLSHSRGFMAMSRKMTLPFDSTLIDIIMNAELPESLEISPLNAILLNKISAVVGGTVVYKNDAFYIVKDDGREIIFSFEAEGLRKFGLLWKLIRNGLFDEPGSVLIWDEPEANLNLELIPILVEILFELQKRGVQLFITTHEYNLARYFDILRKNKEDVAFHHLYKNYGGYITCESSHKYSDIGVKTSIERADKTLGEAIINKAVEEIENE